MPDRKKKVLFIGSFKSSGKDGTVGGQMYACRSLVNSELKDFVSWTLVDTTASTNLKRPFAIRIYHALTRLVKVLYFLLFKDIEVVMAFCSSGYSFLEKGTFLRIAKRLNKRTILFPRSGHILDQIENNENFKRRVKTIFASCDHIISQGSFWRSFFINKFNLSESKVVTISNWIDINKYNSSKRVVGNPPKILFLGWIEENKGVWDILEAVRKLRNEDFIIDIAGNGADFEKLRQAIDNENLEHKINLLDWVYGDEKIKLLSDADILVLPSYREGLPNVLLEAMASYTAVVVSNVGAIPDLIQSGVNGFLINPGDTDSLVKYLKMYLSDNGLILEHSKNALETIREKNTIESVLPKFKKLLK